MHKSESSPSHSVLESKSSHESLNLAHESDSSPSPGLEYYNTATEVDFLFLTNTSSAWLSAMVVHAAFSVYKHNMDAWKKVCQDAQLAVIGQFYAYVCRIGGNQR